MTGPLPLITLRSATFRATPTSTALFPNTTLTLSLTHRLALLGPSKSLFLSLLKGSHLAYPPNSRLYPSFGAHHKWPQSAIQHITFGSGSSSSGLLKGATGGDGYVSARYETLREEFDVTLREWLVGGDHTRGEGGEIERIAGDLGLRDLLDQDVFTLSNGQSRRARIAQALLRKPELLMIDEPFMGLDPPSRKSLSGLLDRISAPAQQESGGKAKGELKVPVVLGLREQDVVPSWVDQLAWVEGNELKAYGEKQSVVDQVRKELGHTIHLEEFASPESQGIVERAWAGIGKLPQSSSSPFESASSSSRTPITPHIEMRNITISYSDRAVIKNFSWTILAGERWGLLGPNGSGKTTLTSLLTSDHPKTYSLSIRHFGLSRLPTPGSPGVPVFVLQRRIGISSPEIHSFFPRHLTLRRALLSGFADTPLSPPETTKDEEEYAAGIMEEWKDVVPWESRFGEVDLQTQRVVLFLRAVVGRRDLVVLDEAFSGMGEAVRERCFGMLEGERWEDGRQALVVISHASEEVPRGVGRWVRLGEKGEKAEFGGF